MAICVGETRRHGSGATLERILVSAETEFAERGLLGGRVQDIAHAAGVTKQLVYHYFPTKGDLYQTLVDRISNRYDALFQMPDFDALPPDEALRLYVSRHFRAHAENGGNLLHDVAQHSDAALHTPRRRREIVAVVASCLGRIVARGQQEGLFASSIETPELLLMINFVTNNAVSTGKCLIALIRPEVPSCPGDGSLEMLCADFILLALTSRGAVPSQAAALGGQAA